MAERDITILVPRGGAPLATAVLRHELPDGTHHFDWLLAQDEGGTRPLITFRLQCPPSELAAGDNLSAERIGDHRQAYLNYEGEVSGFRGHVRRHAAGHIVSWFTNTGHGGEECWELDVEWSTPAGARAAQRLRLTGEKLAEWRLFCVTISSMAE